MTDTTSPQRLRTIRMPDGTARGVRMSEDQWCLYDAIKVIEGITETQLAAYAEEEAELGNLDFDTAFLGCVSFLVNRWTP